MPEHVIKEVLGNVSDQVVWVSKQTRERYWPDGSEVGRHLADVFVDRARFRIRVNGLYDRDGDLIEPIDAEVEWGLADQYSLEIPEDFAIEHAIHYGDRIDLTLLDLRSAPERDWEPLYPGETVEDHHLEPVEISD